MSLKAKIEAVIYASEEPVTLQQLVGLLGQEGQAEIDAAEALQGQLALLDSAPLVLMEVEEAGDQDALNAETLGISGFPPDAAPDGDAAGDAEAPAARAEVAGPDDPAGTPDAEPADAGTPDAGTPDAGTPDLGPPDPETPLDSAGNDVPLAASEESTVDPALGQPRGDAADAPADGTASPTAAEIRGRERRLREYFRSLMEDLVAEYRDSDRGLEIREIAGGFRFATKPEYHDAVRGFVRSLKPPLKLSLQALETLAVVAYKQPVTAPEVSEIRGVDSGGVLGSLMTRKLVTTAGRKQVIGRPILYKTTREFLLRFGLKDLSELPSIEEFERLASDLNEAVQEEIPMNEHLDTLRPAAEVGDAPRNVEPMRDEHEAQADGIPEIRSDARGGPADQDTDDEMLLKPQDGPGEFTGNESAPPVDNATIDGRMSGLPPNYDPSLDEMADSPANDAFVQSQPGAGNGSNR